MAENLDVLHIAVSLLIRAVLFAARFSGRVRRQSLKRFATMGADAKATKTVKYEWLRRVPSIKGFDHLTSLCTEFESWYNGSRPHMTLEGFRPDDLYYDRKPQKPKRDAKAVPGHIERHLFAEARLTAYRNYERESPACACDVPGINHRSSIQVTGALIEQWKEVQMHWHDPESRS